MIQSQVAPAGLSDPFGIIENAPEGFVLIDRSFRVLYENAAACRMLELDRRTVRGRSVFELVPPFEFSKFGEAVQTAMAQQRVVTATARAAIAPRWFALKAYPTQDGLVIYFDDVTEREEAVRALREREERLHLVIEAAQVGIWDAQLGTGTVFASDKLRALCGLPSTVVDLSAFRAILHPDDLSKADAMAAEAPVNDCSWRARVRIHRADSGAERWVELHGKTALADDGQPIRSIGTARDVTDDQLRMEALQHAQRDRQRAQTMAKIGTWSWDLRTNAVHWSPEIWQIFELPPEQEPSIQALNDLYQPADVASWRAAVERTIATLEPYEIEMHTLPSGRVLEVWALGEILTDAHGRPVEMFGTVQDVTDARAQERALLESQRRLKACERETQKLESPGLLAGGIAHDFNNLLVGVLTNASLALLDLPDGHAARDAIADIERAARRAADLTRQLLAYAGKGRYVVEPVRLSDLVREMAQLLRASIARKVTLLLELPDDLPAVLGDATQLRQVVMNLITNASDAMLERGGTLVVRTSLEVSPSLGSEESVFGAPLDPAPRLVVEVTDQGHGMEPEIIERIFDPFFTTKFTGRGLGLSATVGILRQHGGSISVHSTPGKGTTFRLWFIPRDVPATRDLAAPAAAAEPAVGGGTILVVDDDEGVRNVARTLLQRRGFSVLLAEDGREGLERFLAASPALRGVILDLTMPVMGGAEALAAMRIERPAVPVLLMSGYTEDELQPTFAGRASGFLQKPFRAQELYDAVAAMLGTAAP